MKEKRFFLVAIMLLTINFSKAQTLKVDRIIFAWGNMKNMVVNTAKLLPEEKWDFTADEKVLSFKELVKHIATSNRFFTGTLAGRSEEIKVKNEATSKLIGKDEIIKDLEESFDFAIESIKRVENWDDVFNAYGNEVSKLEFLMQGEHHLHREQGKVIVLMRMNGIAPAKSTSWFL